MSARVFEIDELARLISSHLLTDRPTLVSLACTCRVLEVPALSSLWITQRSFTTLINLLPVKDEEASERNILGNAWDRFRRYASWIRQLRMEGADRRVTKVTVNRLLTSSPNGLLCPNLSHLDCYVTEDILPLIPLLLSPRLTHLTLLSYRDIPGLDLGPIFRALPIPCLQALFLDIGSETMKDFADEISSMIRRCGDSLRRLHVSIPLGEATVHHLLRLQNLVSWKNVHDGPPISLPPPPIFPSLQALSLRGNDAYGWISWLSRYKRDVLNGSVEYSGSQAPLTCLVFLGPCHVGAAFISPLFLFPNLTVLDAKSACGKGLPCSFSLTNQDVTQLSIALPRLEVLELGRPCAANTTLTTISCLQTLSTHCKSLQDLSIHFNTTNLVEDVRSLSADPDFYNFRSLPTKCPLRFFNIWVLPFPRELPDEEITSIAKAFINIFPSLLRIVSYAHFEWNSLSLRISQLQETSVPVSKN